MKSIATKVGIDVSKGTLDLLIERETGQKKVAVSNDPKGVAQILELLKGGCYLIALESTGRYEALVRHALEAAGHDVRVQNPRHVRKLAQGMGIQAKTDGLDAKVLARTAELCPKTQPRSKEREALGDLSRTIETLKQQRSGHKKRLGVPGFSTLAVQSIQKIIKALDKEIKVLEAAFVREVTQSRWAEPYTLALSVPGVGEHLARIAICELPENLKEWESRQLASYASIAPMSDSSGKRTGVAKVGKHGNLHLKAGLYMPALALLRRDSWGREVYHRLKEKGRTHQQALIPVMRKLFIQLVSVLKRGSAWQPDPPKRA